MSDKIKLVSRPVERNDATRTKTSPINGGNTKSELLEKAQLHRIKQIESQKKQEKERKRREAELNDPNFIKKVNDKYASKEVQNKTFNSLSDLVSMVSGGFVKTPSEIVRLGYDVVKGNPIFTDENGNLRSWWRNNGIMPDDSNPYLSTGVNTLFDLATGSGLYKLGKWGNTYKKIPSTEYTVYKKPFSRYVYKVPNNSDLEYIELKNSTPGFERMIHYGNTIEGKPVFQQHKLISSNNIKSFIKDRVKDNMFPTKFKGYDETILVKPSPTGQTLFYGDFPGNIGFRWYNPFRKLAYDLSILNGNDMRFLVMKNGGKLWMT